MFRSLTRSLIPATLALAWVSSMSLPAAAAPAPAAGEKEWTFLIFLNGNNNLDSFGAFNINQMEKIGSNENVNIVVQWASLQTKTVRRLLVQKDANPSRVTSPIVQDLGRVDMGDYRSLVEFIQWGHANYPAKKYFVDVWDHGSGWHALQARLRGRAQGTPLSFSPSDISWDDLTGNSMTTKQLGVAMAEGAKTIGHRIDIYGSDACLMGMFEVAGEMKDSVHVFVGSQETEPGAGWPYDDILRRWTAKADATAQDVGTYLVEEYIASYSGGQNGREDVTMSAFDLTKTAEMNTAIAALGQRLSVLDASGRQATLNAVNSSVGFYYSDYVDFGDFVNHLESAKVASIDAELVNALRSGLKNYVVANKATGYYAKAQGASIWLPASTYAYREYADAYKTLQFNAETNWAAAIENILKK